jgi:pimeloyl-ACP methyl ester carboxylesterase
VPGPKDELDETSDDLTLAITGIDAARQEDGSFRILIQTSRGDIPCLFNACEGEPGVAVFLGGAMGGFEGPANGMYRRLAESLVTKGMSALRVHYRQPGEFEECVLDVLGTLSFLKGIGAGQVVLVGHSFGGAVVIKAGELSPQVAGVAALSSQRYGTHTVENLAPRPLLLIHGAEDTVLLPAASEDIYARARQPKRLALIEGAGHALTECADDITEMLELFLLAFAGPPGEEDA